MARASPETGLPGAIVRGESDVGRIHQSWLDVRAISLNRLLIVQLAAAAASAAS